MISLRETSVPAPFVVAPTNSWDGDDGSWSTFSLQIGTPPQSFRVLPATTGQEIWIPTTQGCDGGLSGLPDCGDLRGANDFNNTRSRGFLQTNSTSWTELDVYKLSAEQNLFPSNSGNYGRDNISLTQATSSQNASIQDQTIAEISTIDFWLGSLGLGTVPGNFPGHDTYSSLLVSMKAQGLTPSLAYGYTAGKSYASPKIPGSLVLGGFDSTRMSSQNITLPINNSTSLPELQLSVQSATVTPSLTGEVNRLVSDPFQAIIDSAVSQLWLPVPVCQAFQQAFGLEYDSNTGLYLVNSTIHSQLKTNNPTVTFGIGTADRTINVVMGYNAFDLEVGIPLYNQSTPYFPIRQAANASQYVLGRTFLQEAFILVDWERSNFTVAQATSSTSQGIIHAILPPAAQSSTSTTTPSATTLATLTPAPKHGLTAGAIAGIVIAMLALLAIGVGAFFIRRRRRRAKPAELDANPAMPPDYFSPEKQPEKYSEVRTAEAPVYEMQGCSALPSPPSELASADLYEMHHNPYERELAGTPVGELVGSEASSELDVTSVRSSVTSRPHLSRHNSSFTTRHSRYLSIDGHSNRLAELSSEAGSEVDLNSVVSRPQSPGLSPGRSPPGRDRSRYLSIDGGHSPAMVPEEMEEQFTTPPLAPLADSSSQVADIGKLEDSGIANDERGRERRPD